MTDDRLVAWLESQGYDYLPAQNKWIHKVEGMEVIERESRANELREGSILLRDFPEKVKGLARALKTASTPGRNTAMNELREAYQRAQERIREVDTFREAREFQEKDFIQDVEQELSPDRRGFVDVIEDDVRDLSSSVDLPTIEEIMDRIRTAKTRNELEEIRNDISLVPDKQLRETITRVTGIPDREIQPTPRPTSAFTKATIRLDREEKIREQARDLTPQEINLGGVRTVQQFANFWKLTEDEARDLLLDKGFTIRETPGGQERYEL